MSDYGSAYADKSIKQIDKELKETYKTARKELRQKLADFNKRHAARDKVMRSQLSAGEITKQDYQNWLQGQVFIRGQWESKIRQVNNVLLTHNKQAMNIINEHRLDVFAENYNYHAYRAEIATGLSFNGYNSQAVAKLIAENPQILPKWKVQEEKDYDWNYKKVNNIVRQGIIQGESVDDITERLCNDLSSTNERKMNMFARTAVTEAQNAGRQQQMADASKLGLRIHKRWIATLDSRTRDSHRHLDGQEVPYDKPFESDYGEIMFPGDPAAHPGDVYNCRCTMAEVFPDFADLTQNETRRDQETGEVIEYKTYEEWQRKKIQRPMANGKDIVDTWKRREGEFQFEINDVINQQGFDGLPTVMEDEEQFWKLADENRFVATRGYAGTPDNLLAYRDALYNGDWYVDCSNGGALYGKGMYAAVNFDGKLTDKLTYTAKQYAKEAGFVETFTMQGDIKYGMYSDLIKEFNGEAVPAEKLRGLFKALSKDERTFLQYTINPSSIGWDDVNNAAMSIGAEGRKKVTDKYHTELDAAKKEAEAWREKFKDVGSYAAARGYDAIVCGDMNQDGVFAVILNRTKCVFLKGK